MRGVFAICALSATLVGGCVFHLTGADQHSGSVSDSDMGGAFPGDLGMGPPGTIDLGGAPLTGDMSAPIVPSHVGSGYVDPNAADLMDAVAIDTTNLTVTLNGGSPQVMLVSDPKSGAAVLSVHGWTVNRNLQVTGSRPLVVVASGFVDIKAAIGAAANFEQGGPGAVSNASGAGGNGVVSNSADSGGAGGSYGALGAPGGSCNDSAQTSDMGTAVVVPGGAVGSTYGSESLLQGGAPGGKGAGTCVSGSGSQGGAGGGAVQITSTMAITVESSGVINVGGGGGNGGCQYGATGGGGGGSGGAIFLEAPAVTISGWLLANGGGGGGGAAGGSSPGGDGENAAMHNDGKVAKGGTASGDGSAGGAGANETTIAATPGLTMSVVNAGGGGGGLGRIYLRTRGNAASKSGTISGVETDDTTL